MVESRLSRTSSSTTLSFGSCCKRRIEDPDDSIQSKLGYVLIKVLYQLPCRLVIQCVGYISTIYFVIKQNEQHIDLNISNNTNRYDRQKQNIIYKKKSANNKKLKDQMIEG